MQIFLTCSVCLLMMGSECVWALGEGSNFQLVTKLSFKAFSSLTSCVDFEVVHLSVRMAWRLPYRRFLP